MALIDLTGHRFGRWSVLDRAENVKYGYALWRCKCECGVIKVIAGSSLRRLRSQSCGCLNYETRRLPSGEASFNALYKNYKTNAEKRGFEFTLTECNFR